MNKRIFLSLSQKQSPFALQYSATAFLTYNYSLQGVPNQVGKLRKFQEAGSLKENCSPWGSIVWRVNLSKLSRNFFWVLRTTITNCRVSFIDFYLAFPTNFRIIFLPHTKHCNFTGTVLWYYHRAWVTCGKCANRQIDNTCSKQWTQDNDFLILLLSLTYSSLEKKFTSVWQIERHGIRAMNSETRWIHRFNETFSPPSSSSLLKLSNKPCQHIDIRFIF